MVLGLSRADWRAVVAFDEHSQVCVRDEEVGIVALEDEHPEIVTRLEVETHFVEITPHRGVEEVHRRVVESHRGSNWSALLAEIR